MVYYVRFLKPPRFQRQKARSLSITAVVSLTTDLGDSFLAEDVDLLASLALENSDKTVYQKVLSWTTGKRELVISLGPFPEHLSQQTIVLGVNAINPQRAQSRASDNFLDSWAVPQVISAWSAAFGGRKSLKAEKLVERRFGPEDRLDLRIWEETGNSISRHIWDAALASVICLQRAAIGSETAPGPLQKLLHDRHNTPLHAIELGSGCGIVGIALAEMVSQCSVLLTDLPEAEDIVTRNMAAARVAPNSGIEYRNLDWDEGLPEDLCSTSNDLILVSDCTYNADSSPALVSILDQLVQRSPNAIILTALKRRHDSEAVFFDMMHSAAFNTLHKGLVQFPSQHGKMEQIELYCYGRSKSSHSTPSARISTGANHIQFESSP